MRDSRQSGRTANVAAGSQQGRLYLLVAGAAPAGKFGDA
jgi:hypothetical protein